MLARDSRSYESRPFGISGTCKAETEDGQVELIGNAIKACTAVGIGRVWRKVCACARECARAFIGPYGTLMGDP